MRASNEWSVVTGGVLTVAVLVAAVLIVGARISWSIEGPMSGISFDAEDAVLTGVEPWGRAWLLGARPGDPYSRWDDFAGGVVSVSGIDIDIPDRWPSLEPVRALLAAGLLGVALVTYRLAPAAGIVAILASVLLASSDLLGVATGPMLLLTLVAPIAAALLLAVNRWRHGSRVSIVALVALTSLGLAIVAAANLQGPALGELWTPSLALPAAAAIALGLEATWGIWSSSRRAIQARQPVGIAVLQHSTLGRRIIRDVEEEQRDRLAQRLHDRLLPRVRAGLLGMETGDQRASEQELQRLAEELREHALDEQLVVLRTAGLAAAIRDTVELVSSGPIGAVEALPSNGRPPPEVEVAALRITQEAIRNVRAHASANRFIVRVEAHAKRVRVAVEDDGVGIGDQPFEAGPDHLGLRSMQARAAEVGGVLRIEPRPGGGTIVAFDWH